MDQTTHSGRRRTGVRYPLHSEARTWLHDHAPYEAAIVAYLTNRDVGEDINKYYPGGWFAFERDVRTGGVR